MGIPIVAVNLILNDLERSKSKLLIFAKLLIGSELGLMLLFKTKRQTCMQEGGGGGGQTNKR